MFYKQWHFAQEKKKISTVACHSSFSDKDFWIGYILLWISDWFISYFKMHHSRALFWFWWGKKKKKKYDLNENTSGKVNILTGAGEECGRLFQKLKATWLWNFLELSYQHTVTSKFNNWQLVQSFQIRHVAGSRANILCQFGDYLGKSLLLLQYVWVQADTLALKCS